MADWALVIGINQYQNLQSLQYAVNDAELMRNYFTRAGFERVFYFTDNSPEISSPNGGYVSTVPTTGNLFSFLHDFFEQPALNDGDNFWFFFSGHGIRDEGKDYLMPCDGNPRLLEKTAISTQYITERLRNCGADNVILFLDACRNEGAKAGIGIGAGKYQGVITIASCSPKEKSYEIEQLGHGSFTYALEEALRIQGENNCATVERLERRLKTRVREINRFHQKPDQSPYTVVEPASKYHLILLPDQANQTDIDLLKLDAFRASRQKDWRLARQLWRRVNIAARGSDHDAEEGLAEAIFRLRNMSTPTAPKAQAKEISGNKGKVEPRRLEVFKPKTDELPKSFVEDLGNGVKLEMVLIPKGSFLMGSPRGEGRGNEHPQHRVEITQEFYIGKYQITQGQWQTVMGKNPSGFQKGDNYPVEQVSWDDCQNFLEKLNQKTGKKYRLPSEAEWEYACRAGTKTKYYFGDNAEQLKTYAWFRGNAGQTTHPVGEKQPNDWGLYDMHGNIWEWCEDSWEDNYQDKRTQKPLVNSSDRKVRRGGAWSSYPEICRSAARFNPSRGARHFDIGFRVVVTPQ
ncbi:Sulphatase-modifying factor protein [[Leptolyngbya] sp. PCC 7376]|uniref:SUMF1/EgtB/PvdO family nonheme iron enzyme n=1 Tax=[Leptolyngbya] sp. PCC 7376 TaxID=111781 RepID=UPI00029F3BD3|nr:SUMF1/EgtB/PvdO family nonheme iron enzyme [[Leptolyngbya] sp. PCC 7376]AFY39268.1 Sulphatase-modifying factor protein [[Leptolyngbya] sp. PCC 7376]